MFGGGGYNGVLANGLGNVAAGPTDKPAPLARGYVTFGSDSGHQANANGSRDGTFNRNDGALKNFAADAIKKTAMRPLILSRRAMPPGCKNLLRRRLIRRT